MNQNPSNDDGAAAGTGRPITRGLAAIAICCVGTLLVAGAGTHRPLEATAQMEQFAARIDRAKLIHPNTAADIARLLALPQYDCSQVACGPEVQRRNRDIRSHLKAALAAKTRDFAGFGRVPVATDVIVTGATWARRANQ